MAPRGSQRSVNRGIGGLGVELRKLAIRTPTQSSCAEGNMNRGDSASRWSVLRRHRPQTRLETSCTRTGRHARRAPSSMACHFDGQNITCPRLFYYQISDSQDGDLYVFSSMSLAGAERSRTPPSADRCLTACLCLALHLVVYGPVSASLSQWLDGSMARRPSRHPPGTVDRAPSVCH